MKEPVIYREPLHRIEEAISLLAVASALLRYRRMIIALSLLGAVAGLAAGLLSKRVYSARATFIPEEPDKAVSGLAMAAGQFGIKLPSSGESGWGPPIYVELLKTRELLEPIAADTLAVPEESARRMAIADLFRVKPGVPPLRLERTVRALRKKLTVEEDKKIGGVKLTVTTRWPSVSFAIANRLVSGVNQFNLESRKTQAGAERRFVEAQAIEAERILRDSENRLQLFLQRNRGGLAGSPELQLERDRLQRDVTLRQQMFTSLTENQEDAKIREVRN
nr:Wzz/FepE/Etk N-terminal domain-containing protein [Gemmatimonadota bacterium]